MYIVHIQTNKNTPNHSVQNYKRLCTSSIRMNHLSQLTKNDNKSNKKKKFVYYSTIKNHPLQYFICSRTHFGQSMFIWSPWTMNPFLTRWKMLPAYPNPFSPVDSCTKFFTVTGTVCPNKPNSILPTASPPIATSKYTMSVTTVSPAVSLAWNGEK